MKTSYSSIFNEGLDFSCVIFDRDGEMVAYAEFCSRPDRRDPLHHAVDNR